MIALAPVQRECALRAQQCSFCMMTPSSNPFSDFAALWRTIGVSSGHTIGSFRDLEVESIGILRETAAVLERPVMLCAIGKDSTTLLHLALKAFWPFAPPFALLHVDSHWKFQEMVPVRDSLMASLGLKIIVHVNEAGAAAGINPFTP
ncbi:MAG: phosphoadenosine phosphosulfate reductase family protein [Caulobacterales bacterium]